MINKISKIFAPILVATALTFTAQAGQVSIKGTGQVSQAPDVAYIEIGVNSNAATARIALDKNTKAMNNVINALDKEGVEKKHIQTSNFSINPKYKRTKDYNELPEVIGYQVYNMLNVKVSDVEKLGAILDKVVTVGSNQINNIRFSFEDASSLKNEARKLAAQDAKAKAELYAQTLGFSLGKIISINENVRSAPAPMPMMKSARFEADMGSMPAAVEIGEQSVSSSVDIAWEIIEE